MKNINSTHRIEGVPSQFGLSGALAASKVDAAAHRLKSAAGGLGDQVRNILRAE